MRQAPPQYAIIGNGRMATHFRHYLDLSGISFVHWHRGLGAPLEALLPETNTVLLLIDDGAIAVFMQQHPELADKVVVHFSGAHVITGAIGMHPLYSFSDRLYSLEDYQSIPFCVDQKALSFQSIFPSLKNPSYFIDPEKKPYYHALCVMANNFTTLLWRKFFTAMESEIGIDAKCAFPFLKVTADNILKNAEGALTGPLVRKDKLTIEKNLAALTNDPYRNIYEAFACHYEVNDENNS